MADNMSSVTQYRITQAKEQLRSAGLLAQTADYSSCVYFSCMAVFHAIRALDARETFRGWEYEQVLEYFERGYIETGMFDDQMRQVIRRAAALYEREEYDDFYTAAPEEAAEIQNLAEMFVSTVEEHLRHSS